MCEHARKYCLHALPCGHGKLASYFCSGVVQRQMAAQARSTSTCKPTRRAGSRPSRCRSTRCAGSVAKPLHGTLVWSAQKQQGMQIWSRKEILWGTAAGQPMLARCSANAITYACYILISTLQQPNKHSFTACMPGKHSDGLHACTRSGSGTR